MKRCGEPHPMDETPCILGAGDHPDHFDGSSWWSPAPAQARLATTRGQARALAQRVVRESQPVRRSSPTTGRR